MKCSQAISHIKCLYKTNVLRTILVCIITSLTKMILKTSVLYRHLMRLITQEHFVEFSHRKNFKSYIM
jgi:hypothetical protein